MTDSCPRTTSAHAGFNAPIFDSRLSWAERGVLEYILQHPYRRRFHLNELYANGKLCVDSRRSTRQAVEHLRAHGYVTMSGSFVEAVNHG